jgi:hypothetical protein
MLTAPSNPARRSVSAQRWPASPPPTMTIGSPRLPFPFNSLMTASLLSARKEIAGCV